MTTANSPATPTFVERLKPATVKRPDPPALSECPRCGRRAFAVGKGCRECGQRG